MNRQQLILSILGVVVVLAGVLILFWSHTTASTAITYDELQQKALHQQKFPNCLDAELTNVPDQAQKALFKAVDLKATHRPRTTAFGVKFASYTNSRTTGVIAYDGEANNFNFVAAKDGNSWKINNLEACTTH